MAREPRLLNPVTKNDHIQGKFDAPVTLVQFGDYECPACGMAFSIVKEVQKKLGPELRFVFRNFPLTNVHPHAELAAEAAESANAQGRFWEMHDLLYENQESLSGDMVFELAERLGLDTKEFLADMESHKFLGRIKADFLGGVRSGVSGTPTFYINGLRLDSSWEAPALVMALRSAEESHRNIRGSKQRKGA